MSNWHGKCRGKYIYFMTNIKRNKFLCSFFTCSYYFKRFPAGIIYTVYFILISNYLLLPSNTNWQWRWNNSNRNRIKYSKAIRYSAHLLTKGNIVFIISNLPIYLNKTIVIFKIIHIIIYFRRNFYDVGIYLNAVLDMEVFILTFLLVPLSLGGRLTKGICS